MKVKYYAIILLTMMLFGCESEQDKTVINYCKSLEAGKFDDAVSYLSESAKQELVKAGGKQALAAVSDMFKQRKGIKAIKITKREVTKETAIIKFNYTFNDGSQNSDYFPLVKENGKWKITK